MKDEVDEIMGGGAAAFWCKDVAVRDVILMLMVRALPLRTVGLALAGLGEGRGDGQRKTWVVSTDPRQFFFTGLPWSCESSAVTPLVEHAFTSDGAESAEVRGAKRRFRTNHGATERTTQ